MTCSSTSLLVHHLDHPASATALPRVHSDDPLHRPVHRGDLLARGDRRGALAAVISRAVTRSGISVWGHIGQAFVGVALVIVAALVIGHGVAFIRFRRAQRRQP